MSGAPEIPEASPGRFLLATTTPGLETVALRELAELTGRNGWVEHRGLVGLPGEESEMARVNLCARSIFRVYWVLGRGPVEGLEPLYEQLRALRFGHLLAPEQSLAVAVTRRGDHPFNSEDIARVAGQAILDAYRAERGVRPPVDLDAPDVEFRLEVRDDRFWLGIDTTGRASLAERGYRRNAHPAALKPPIGYAMVRLAEWRPDESLLDPMCGSATIPIEAAAYARGELHRRAFAFERFVWHERRWLDEARARTLPHDASLRLRGYEVSPRHLAGARRNVAAAAAPVELLQADATTASLAADRLVVNLPYGIRMGSPRKVAALYHALAANLDRWPWRRLVAATARPKLLVRAMGRAPARELEILHGGIYTHLLVFEPA
ncbi:MAG: hypothetical protein GWO02_02740 [Gammaproteobacteria bacterium]|nr:hypothetical protein [Gammaproteobacteria bacterium]